MIARWPFHWRMCVPYSKEVTSIQKGSIVICQILWKSDRGSENMLFLFCRLPGTTRPVSAFAAFVFWFFFWKPNRMEIMNTFFRKITPLAKSPWAPRGTPTMPFWHSDDHHRCRISRNLFFVLSSSTGGNGFKPPRKQVGPFLGEKRGIWLSAH